MLLLNLNTGIFPLIGINWRKRFIPLLCTPFHFLRPRKQTQRVDRCRTKKQYKNRRHFRGYYYRWMGSY
ncbi:conserved Plasmodium protein, unknown function [Plasmodium vivax]|uniref:Uncharacterized protein n=6 Tax=Plasmodium vivax TaxID=5855 RepID=A5K8I0_PLAVS|nr:hypothetical protein PVX_100530 [Plasmodium vivax]KMZ77729.1 hypothetical protein PVIIG_03961 [Plasmodium vivax India VII]KMZ84573.1 hypothetical protein PVBG_00353 [Plasmodium vivax Brazil I]KMZ90352.1 hypothetical protein PVMG_01719 [Plasmodium vivax Mauritania I]KMZ96705.1 hypothetical protein PVNG_02724 [Plasmodium vivax North Korean]EDL44126.1 hypothetical protein PVX_100530 [Plasmodium vivax]|eukprot:XP_001613853.1 hypothetical protein [Plasmodium vivax Sal-1]